MRKTCARNSGIGGQAVMEGIMMRNKDKYAIAVRKPDGEIDIRVDDYKSVIGIPAFQKVPILRGVVNFIDSLVIGIQCLMYSASFFEDEEEDKDKKKKKEKKETSGKEADHGEEDGGKEKKDSDNLFIAGTLTLALVMAVVLFMVVPLFVSRRLGQNFSSPFARSVLESAVRIGVFLAYMIGISRLKDIQRTFEYHGAEHKCINCIENGRELTVDNVLISSRLHKRCGTSFLFFVILVSVAFQMFIYSENRLTQLGVRLLLIPVIAGVSYEIIRLAGSSNHPLVNLLSRPGLALQKLTTREPDASQAEVAIRAVEAVFDWRAFLEGPDGGKGT